VIIGGLSEQEIKKISELLKSEEIPFEVKTDESMIAANQQSMKNNIRHLTAPSISTHILSIKVKEESFNHMSSGLKESLLEFGITDQVPSEIELQNTEPEIIRNHLNRNNNRIIGANFKHQIIFGLISLTCYLLYHYLKS
jgi:hypothetical protein